MAAEGRYFAFVGEGIYDLWCPHPKKFATKGSTTDLGNIRCLFITY